MDIRQLPLTSTLPTYLNPKLPTLFISECCLIYVDLNQATEIIRWIVETFQESGVGLIMYEPIGGNDAFGKVMIRNLATRGINLKTLSAYATLQQQKIRLKDCGFVAGQDAVDINFAHDHWMGQDELQRIAKLEMLDEIEEWQLLARHYCIVWGWADAAGEAGSTEDAFHLWRNIKNTHA